MPGAYARYKTWREKNRADGCAAVAGLTCSLIVLVLLVLMLLSQKPSPPAGGTGTGVGQAVGVGLAGMGEGLGKAFFLVMVVVAGLPGLLLSLLTTLVGLFRKEARFALVLGLCGLTANAVNIVLIDRILNR
jgi:hypothetical protein